MKILSVGHSQSKYGKLSSLFTKKLNYGLIRLGHHVYEFDDRVVARSESFFNSRLGGVAKVNRRFLEVCDNFEPDIVFLGHVDLFSRDTLPACRRRLPRIRIAHWNNDPYYRPNICRRFELFAGTADALFATTGGDILAAYKRPGNRVAFIPNAVDVAIDRLQNDRSDRFDIDLLFCGTASTFGLRDAMLERLAAEERLKRAGVRFELRGLQGNPGVYGAAYDRLLAQSKMALNLSKDNEAPLYSSDRISQLLGNGILTFIPLSTGLEEIIPWTEAVFFSDYEDLVERIRFFHTHDAERKKIAEAGRISAQKRFSSERIAKFMVEFTLASPLSEAYEWDRHIFP